MEESKLVLLLHLENDSETSNLICTGMRLLQFRGCWEE